MCDEALRLYNASLKENGYRPYPVYWTKPNCGGSFYPNEPIITSEHKGVVVVEGEAAFGSFYCPPGVDYITNARYDPDDNSKVATKATLMANAPDSAVVELLLEDTTKVCAVPLFFGEGTAEANASVASLYSDGTIQIDYTQSVSVMEMCTGSTVSIAGDPDLQGAYYPKSPACDDYMTRYCSANPDKKLCNCFRDRETLRQLMPDVVLPVRCLGPNCAITGYLTKVMAEQGCDLDMCQSVTQMFGSALATGGRTSIYCGNRLYDVTPPPGPTPTRPVTVEDDRISTVTWVLSAVGVAILAVVIGLFYRYRPKKRP